MTDSCWTKNRQALKKINELQDVALFLNFYWTRALNRSASDHDQNTSEEIIQMVTDGIIIFIRYDLNYRKISALISVTLVVYDIVTEINTTEVIDRPKVGPIFPCYFYFCMNFR